MVIVVLVMDAIVVRVWSSMWPHENYRGIITWIGKVPFAGGALKLGFITAVGGIWAMLVGVMDGVGQPMGLIVVHAGSCNTKLIPDMQGSGDEDDLKGELWLAWWWKSNRAVYAWSIWTFIFKGDPFRKQYNFNEDKNKQALARI